MKHCLKSSRRAIATTLGNRSLRRILAAYFLFACGENGVWLAVSVFAYRQGGIAAVGIVSVAQLIPAVAFAPFGAALGSRLRPTIALALGYGLQCLTTALLAASMLGASPRLVYVAAILASCSITLTRPAHHGLLPQLAQSPEELTAANSLSSLMEGLGVMIGPALTGGLIVVAGVVGGPVLFAMTFCLAAALAGRAGPTETANPRRIPPPLESQRVLDASKGLLEVSRNRGAGLLVVLGGGQFLVAGMLDVFFVALAVEVLHRSESVSGLLAAAGGIGALVGAAASALLIARRRMRPGIAGGVVVMGAGLVLIPTSPTLAAMVVLIGVAEAGRTLFDVAARTLLQRSADSNALARLFGVQESLVMLSLAIGAAIAPLLAARFGIQGAFVVATAVVALVGAASWSTLRHLDREAVLPDRALLALLRKVPIFTPLPPYELEQLAGRLVRVAFEADSVVIRQGDPGDLFYVLARGRAVVESEGRRVADCRRGDYFGEIALLRDIPRTATVRATTDVELLALAREDFLAAVTGCPTGAAVVHAEIDRRLAELEAD